MDIRRWRDPRSGKVWEVGACPPGTVRAGKGWSVLCFVSTETPRTGRTIRCCTGVGDAIPRLDDQTLALCLDAAAAREGLLWMDPRDQGLWWVRRGTGRGRPLLFTSLRRDVEVAGSPIPEDLEPRALSALLDRGAPATAA